MALRILPRMAVRTRALDDEVVAENIGNSPESLARDGRAMY